MTISSLVVFGYANILLFRLKADYQKFLKELGETGAGLDPADVVPDSNIANIIGM